MLPLAGPVKVKVAVLPEQIGDVEFTFAVSGGFTVTVEFPVTLLVQVPSVTDTKFTVWLAVVLGTVSVNEPDALSVAEAGVPFKV